MTQPGFHMIGGELHAEGVPLSALAREHGTPLYVYSAGLLRANYRRIADALMTGCFRRISVDTAIAYSVKANSNPAILRLLADDGASFDIVSGGELERVRAIGVGGERVIFAGVGKSRSELAAAVAFGVREINIECEREAERLNEIAAAAGVRARAALRLNPNIDAQTHEYISTGRHENKFGLSLSSARALALRICAEMPAIELDGLHAHVGSQILDPAVHLQTLDAVATFAESLRDAGVPIRTLNIGGGFGIRYQEGQSPLDLAPLAAAMAKTAKRLGVRFVVEPGRSIAGPAGVLLTRVEYLKRGEEKLFIVVDASMTDLIRPALYGAHHGIEAVRPRPAARREIADVVGPVCESGDFLAKDRPMPVPEEDDLLAIRDAGAYGFAMASNYNSRPRPAEVMVEGEQATIVRERERLGIAGS